MYLFTNLPLHVLEMLFWETGSRMDTFMNPTILTSSRPDLIAIYRPYLHYIHPIAPPLLFTFQIIYFYNFNKLTSHIECL